MKELVLSYLPESLKDSKTRNGFLTLIFIALIMLIVEYYGWQGPFRRLGRMIPFVRNDLANFNLYSQIFTSVSFLSFFFLLPLLFNKIFPIEEDQETGLGGFDVASSLKTYFPLIVLMLPLVWLATSSP